MLNTAHALLIAVIQHLLVKNMLNSRRGLSESGILTVEQEAANLRRPLYTQIPHPSQMKTMARGSE